MPGNCQWRRRDENSRYTSIVKLGDMEAITIRERYKNGEKVKDLAAEYGVCIATINNVNAVTPLHPEKPYTLAMSRYVRT